MKMRDDWLDGFTYRIEGTPCQTAVEEHRAVHIPDRIVELYRGDPAFARYGPVSYLGVPLFDVDGRIIGQLAVLDDKPMPRRAARHGHLPDLREPRRRRAPATASAIVRSASARLSSAGCSRSAMDAIVNLDDELRIALMNPAARARVRLRQRRLPIGRDFRELLSAESQAASRPTACASSRRASDEREPLDRRRTAARITREARRFTPKRRSRTTGRRSPLVHADPA